MAVERSGRCYVTGVVGVQVFDPTGRHCGVLPKVDGDKPLTTCMLVGECLNTLYIAHGNGIYLRLLTADRPKR